MVGATLRRKRDRALYRVVGRDGGQWVLAPETFGGAISLSELELRELYAVVTEADSDAAPTPAVRVLGQSDAEAAGREAMRAQMEQQISNRAPSPRGRTPEDVFDAARLGPAGK